VDSEKIYQVKIAPAAYHDINRHFFFLAKVSKNAATRLKNTLLKDIRSLEKMPERNPMYDRIGVTPGKYRYMLSANRYRIVFEIVRNIVRVNGIEDCRQSNESKIL